MKMTKTFTHVATKASLEAAITEKQLIEAFEVHGIEGFAAELDIAERTEDHVQMISLDSMIEFVKAYGVRAVAYDVTYFPHADAAEVAYQLKQLGKDLEISPEVIKATCAEGIAEYLELDAKRDASMPVHTIVEAYIGGTAIAWYGMNDYPRLKHVLLRKLVEGGAEAEEAFITKAAKTQVELLEEQEVFF